MSLCGAVGTRWWIVAPEQIDDSGRRDDITASCDEDAQDGALTLTTEVE